MPDTVAMSTRCSWCPDNLVFIQGMGYVHPEGTREKRREENGDLVTDHFALPVSQHPAVRTMVT